MSEHASKESFLPLETSTASPPDHRGEACRLFMGNLPKVKTEIEICAEVSRKTDGLMRVITYKNFENPRLHRGFCFLDYESGKAAAVAKQRLSGCTVFGCRTIVDWADPEPEPDAQQMANVRILFVRQYGGTLSERTLADVFGRYGTVERVKNLKNYAFVHFERRSDARDAMAALDDTVDEATGIRIDVSWAKPPAEKHVRERVLRDREQRIRKQARGPNQSSAEYEVCGGGGPVVRFAHTSDTSTTVVPPPYSNYDHYEYDFNRQTVGCAFPVGDKAPEALQPEPEQRVGLSSVDDHCCHHRHAERDNSDGGNEDYGQRRWWPRQRQSLQRRGPVASFSGTFAADRLGHGDGSGNISDLDSIVLNFFHKKIHSTFDSL